MPETLHLRDGAGALATRLAERGARRVLLLTPPSRRFADRIAPALAAFSPEIFDGAEVHVPAEVVERAARKLVETGADTLVAVGGGSAIGLGKALRLTHDVRFAVVPTTYAGSEMTSMYGTTAGGKKSTGRDPHVRPDLVLYDPTLTASLPVGLSVQSLMNALAHPISVLSTGSLDGAPRAQALAAIGVLVEAMEALLVAPADLDAREAAQRGASAAAEALDRGKPGTQHALAHILGGALDLPHAPLHAVLLVQFVAHLRATQPELLEELARAAGRPDLEPALHDLLTRAGVPTSLDGLGVDGAKTRTVADSPIVLDAQHGLRPTGRDGRIALGQSPLALLSGPRPEAARRIVVCLHGRGAEAGSIVRRYREIVGPDRSVAVIGVRTPTTLNRWYGVRYAEPGAGGDPEVLAALARVDETLAALPRERTFLAGFSQGSCLALEYAARHGAGLAGILAPAGARIGRPDEWTPGPSFPGLPVLLGAAEDDPWVDPAHLEATAAWFRAAGAAVDVIGWPGERHDISTRQRQRARALVGALPVAERLRPPTRSRPPGAPAGGTGDLLDGLDGEAFSADRDMERRAFRDETDDLLLVPEEGALTVVTELGVLDVRPGQICSIPRGVAFAVLLHGHAARGRLAPGPATADGTPATPWFEDRLAPDFRVVTRTRTGLVEVSQDYAPWDVVTTAGDRVPRVRDQ